MATPFRNKQFTFTQPDGTKLQVRGTGDQNYAVFETLDGYTVTKNPHTGFYEIATLSSDGSNLEGVGVAPHTPDAPAAKAAVRPGIRINPDVARARGLSAARRMGGRRCDQRREEQRSFAKAARLSEGVLFAPPSRETVGDFVGLCLLIDFSDAPAAITREQVADFCNKPGYTGFGNNGSVSDFYRANSIDRCRYTNIVMPYYRAQHPKTYYTDPAIPQGVRARELILEAINHFKATGFDFSQLTADSQGFVYAMNIYYAGEVVNNWGEGLWPHAWSLETKVQVAPGKSVFDYQFTDMSTQLTLGTFCHENGHMLCDYPDLYDYGSESSGVGGFCLMCAGGLADERNPGHISAYLKRKSGWGNTVTSIQHDKTVTLAAGTNDFAIFMKNAGEYFIVENRAKTGRDASLPDEGLCIWHVDEDGNNSNEQRTPASHYELSLVQADGNFRLETSRGHLGDATDLFGRTNKRFANTTAPNSKWWDGTVSNLDIFEISNPGPSITFRTRLMEGGTGGGTGGGGGGTTTTTLHRDSAPRKAIPDNNPIGISDIINVEESGTIASTAVTINITHTFRGDLQASLLTPWGASVVLHPRNQGGSADNINRTILEADLPALATFRGRSVKGPWRLTVQDLAVADIGTLDSWALDFTTTPATSSAVTLEETPGVIIPDNNPTGVERSLAANSPATVGRVELSVDISHSFIGDLRIALRSPAGTEVVVHNLVGGSGDNVVTTFTPATTPALNNFAGQAIGGTWKLNVSDRAPLDIGKLNSWKLMIRPPE